VPPAGQGGGWGAGAAWGTIPAPGQGWCGTRRVCSAQGKDYKWPLAGVAPVVAGPRQQLSSSSACCTALGQAQGQALGQAGGPPLLSLPTSPSAPLHAPPPPTPQPPTPTPLPQARQELEKVVQRAGYKAGARQQQLAAAAGELQEQLAAAQAAAEQSARELADVRGQVAGTVTDALLQVGGCWRAKWARAGWGARTCAAGCGSPPAPTEPGPGGCAQRLRRGCSPSVAPQQRAQQAPAWPRGGGQQRPRPRKHLTARGARARAGACGERGDAGRGRPGGAVGQAGRAVGGAGAARAAGAGRGADGGAAGARLPVPHPPAPASSPTQRASCRAAPLPAARRPAADVCTCGSGPACLPAARPPPQEAQALAARQQQLEARAGDLQAEVSGLAAAAAALLGPALLEKAALLQARVDRALRLLARIESGEMAEGKVGQGGRGAPPGTGRHSCWHGG
jgi:hypothetical protein